MKIYNEKLKEQYGFKTEEQLQKEIKQFEKDIDTGKFQCPKSSIRTLNRLMEEETRPIYTRDYYLSGSKLFHDVRKFALIKQGLDALEKSTRIDSDKLNAYYCYKGLLINMQDECTSYLSFSDDFKSEITLYYDEDQDKIRTLIDNEKIQMTVLPLMIAANEKDEFYADNLADEKQRLADAEHDYAALSKLDTDRIDAYYAVMDAYDIPCFGKYKEQDLPGANVKRIKLQK